jgi:hypothetical protein
MTCPILCLHGARGLWAQQGFSEHCWQHCFCGAGPDPQLPRPPRPLYLPAEVSLSYHTDHVCVQVLQGVVGACSLFCFVWGWWGVVLDSKCPPYHLLGTWEAEMRKIIAPGQKFKRPHLSGKKLGTVA